MVSLTSLTEPVEILQVSLCKVNYIRCQIIFMAIIIVFTSVGEQSITK